MCPRIVTKSRQKLLHEQLWFVQQQYQVHLKAYSRLLKEFGTGHQREWTELQEKIRQYSALQESLKELIRFRAIGLWN